MSRGVRIWVTTHNRLYDPTNARDRRSLLEDAVDAEYESDKTSERRKRSAKAAAEAGRRASLLLNAETRAPPGSAQGERLVALSPNSLVITAPMAQARAQGPL
ncbi:MAG: hypothetical protein IJG47_06210 [Microbacterium sp.]|nr:hypothetical protein [Microbacterium sp.]